MPTPLPILVFVFLPHPQLLSLSFFTPAATTAIFLSFYLSLSAFL